MQIVSINTKIKRGSIVINATVWKFPKPVPSITATIENNIDNITLKNSKTVNKFVSKISQNIIKIVYYKTIVKKIETLTNLDK